MFTLLDLQTELVHPLEDLLVLAALERQMEIPNILDQVPRFDNTGNDFLAQLEHRNDTGNTDLRFGGLGQMADCQQTGTDQQSQG